MHNRFLKLGQVLMSALILIVCVAASIIALASRMNNFVLDDSGAISLVAVENSPAEETQQEISTETAAPESTKAEEETKKPQASQNFAPGFDVEDEAGLWSTTTEIEIFKVSYENGKGNITVQSSDGEKVFAPGTDNSYTFKLKNTGNVALDYTVDIDAYFTPDDINIPITARINRYDGLWLAGGKDSYVNVLSLDSASDSATLGAGKYTYYTLDWQWIFESGNDEFDTMLGNLAAAGEDLSLTIVIKTTAEADYTETDSPGITPPQTGDINQAGFWIVLCVGSGILFVIMITMQCEEKREKRAEAKTVEAKTK